MREITISLNSIDKVKNFVAITTKFDADIDLVSGRYVIDAKSIMGIFSMDLSKPIILRIYEDVEEKVADIIGELSEYVKEENERKNIETTKYNILSEQGIAK